ncbi:hypothetical protein Salat_1125400 [Sesamum alatum]|uniref:Uncharacterized protein n=1 Tax=Sesamum alatum TaxID=300844 RepID=A0AAE1YDU2_9LAMI|nr:hypothetical protein Salat_1125400 [Sesamum alatum]
MALRLRSLLARLNVTSLVVVPPEGVVVLGSNTDASGSKEAEVAALGGGDEGPSKKRCRKGKKHRNKGSSKSNKRSKSWSERRAAKDAAEEAENTKHYKEMLTWWKQAREELRLPNSRTAEMEGDKLDPGWAISARSSVLRSLVGQDSWELYKACLLERDQAMAFSHDLSLKCSMFRHQRRIVESKVLEAQQEKAALDDKGALEARIASLESSLQHATEATKKSVAEALEQGKNEGFSAGRVAGRTEGLIEGHDVFLQSDEYKKLVSEHRLQGAKDFLKPPAFKMAVEIQTACFLNEGFDKCISQVEHLKGFATEFNRSLLDPSLDAKLQPYVEDADPEVEEEDEFEPLISEIGQVPGC